MSSTPSGAEPRFDFSGGRLSLDLANTVSGDRSATVRERLPDYRAFVAWARQGGAVSDDHARRLLAEAERRPEEAAAVHREAIALREALYRIFLAAAEEREPAEPDLALLSERLGAALSHRRIARGGKACCSLTWSDPPDALEAPLWRVVVSATELLTSDADLARVRVCGLHDTHECSWLFLDQTRARTRRWCSMKDCGNRAKARRHYERARQGERP